MAEFGPETRRRVAFAVAAAALLINAAAALPDLWRQRPFGVGPLGGGEVPLKDFASHLRMARAALARPWRDAPSTSSIYTPEAHREMTRDWAGGDLPAALPFGYSPTMIWVLAPLTLFDDATAYVLWSLLGLGLVGWLLWPREDAPVVAGLIFLSPLSTNAFALGQTAVYSNAVLLLLARPRRAWLDAALLWLLTAKPPVALMAGAALLAVGRWRAVGLALALALLSTALAHPLLGPGWAGDYLALARRYNSEEADPLFRWCLLPHYMANLRAALWAAGASDALAARLSALAWAVATALVVVAGWRRWLAAWAVWCLALLAFLLLSPHVNVTEDLHLHAACVIAFAATRGAATELARVLPALFVAGVWASSLLRVAPALGPWPGVAAKAALVAAVLMLARQRRA